MSEPIVAIVAGSNSDAELIKEASRTLSELGVLHEKRIISAHRTPEIALEFARTARAYGLKVIIAIAGKAAHLAGVIASETTLPVIGVPAKTSDLGGLDSLLSTVQMPSGVPVATVAIGKSGAKNAALLAVQILALSDEALAIRYAEFKAGLAQQVTQDDREIKKT
ncbi:MAG: 5-(carboxyamino)imidazole ribonucleotide mutase [Candidatus Coatesbacteria bacterium]|nr:5-(carboxyamino)imidazole ribonucleotide mutase [Candidatus Coatesbacteria bacterium]